MSFEFMSTECCRFFFLILAVMMVPEEEDSVEILVELEVRWREDLFGKGMAVPWFVDYYIRCTYIGQIVFSAR